MMQEMMGWQWHQLDDMQIICTSVTLICGTLEEHLFTYLTPDR